MAGAVAVLVNPLAQRQELARQMADAGANTVLTLSRFYPGVVEPLQQEGLVRNVILTNVKTYLPWYQRLLFALTRERREGHRLSDYQADKVLWWERLIHRSPGTSAPVPILADDLAALLYTGGTTGEPKGVMLTHRNLVANMLQARSAIGEHLTDGEELVIAPLPVYHIYTFTVNCLFLMETGNHSLLITNPRDLPNFVKELKGLPFTGFIGLNTLFNALCNRDDFKQLDFSKLKLTISGGMALTKAAAQRWEETTGCPIAEGYGLTETSPIVSFNPNDAIQLGTIGKPVAGTSVKVVDADGNDVPFGEPGELCVQGPQVMKGYWQREEETRNAIDENGWFHTGDIAVLQSDGYIKIVDRKKDMILVSGFNVYPNEVEDVVAAHPDVLEAAAVGVADENAGEAIKLFVVSKNSQLDADTLRAWCKKELTAYKVPKYIEFRDELPKTNVGKVLRRQLRDQEATPAP
jgi:long-chain acyl-CoA synthetase